jgi:hypothetical protein
VLPFVLLSYVSQGYDSRIRGILKA